jgi:dTDP-4-dehydrorhamnose 3,5-epimerase
MKIIKTSLEGFVAIEPDIFKDDRGFFLETYQEERYKTSGIIDKFEQDNHSRSHKNVLRGMHFQIKKPQSKIVTIIRGKIFDVVVDLRKESKTFGQWSGVELSDHSRVRQVYISSGFAHGFLVLSEFADLHYKISGKYNPADEGGLVWNDLDVGIEWPGSNFIVNQRDSEFPKFNQLI